MNMMYEDLSPLLEDHCYAVDALLRMLSKFHKSREETYKLSFAKRGEYGVWMNLARKYDRIDGLASKAFAGGNGVPLVDTLVDTALYALKWLAIIQYTRSEDLEDWLLQHKDETGLDKLTLNTSMEYPYIDLLFGSLYETQQVDDRISTLQTIIANAKRNDDQYAARLFKEVLNNVS